MIERLRRLETTYERQPLYFITTCTHARRHILANAGIHRSFVEFAQRGADRGAWVGRYVLMPDHLHLFVSLEPDQMGLSAWVGSLKKGISKVLRERGESSPHWQKGFFDHIMRGGESYSLKWDYVRENPVRAGLVARAEDWPYSGEIHNLEYRKDLIL
jgi:REP element-mobilizing transposase RayT